MNKDHVSELEISLKTIVNRTPKIIRLHHYTSRPLKDRLKQIVYILKGMTKL